MKAMSELTEALMPLMVAITNDRLPSHLVRRLYNKAREYVINRVTLVWTPPSTQKSLPAFLPHTNPLLQHLILPPPEIDLDPFTKSYV